MRERAAIALGDFGPSAKRAVPALVIALRDKGTWVGRAAAEALGEIGPGAKDALPALEAAVRDGFWVNESVLEKIRGAR